MKHWSKQIWTGLVSVSLCLALLAGMTPVGAITVEQMRDLLRLCENQIVNAIYIPAFKLQNIGIGSGILIFGDYYIQSRCSFLVVLISDIRKLQDDMRDICRRSCLTGRKSCTGAHLISPRFMGCRSRNRCCGSIRLIRIKNQSQTLRRTIIHIRISRPARRRCNRPTRIIGEIHITGKIAGPIAIPSGLVRDIHRSIQIRRGIQTHIFIHVTQIYPG